ncbi:MAG: hypothetical protein IT494_06280 [Gammaproteobacteria bacterium]|nr:hypothetical protein [Gammaproteobacteria bacterium]
MRRWTAFVIVLLCGTGCATNIAIKPPSEIAAQVEVKDSSFDQRITYTGPEVFESKSRGLLTDHQRYRLRAWTDRKSGSFSYQLYAKVWYNTGGWRHYRSASFEDGKQAEVVRISAEPSCMSRGGYTSCSYEEVVGVSMPHDFVSSKATSGFTVRINSQGGYESFFTVPPNYIQGFLDSLSR